jgi:hypothetical protein
MLRDRLPRFSTRIFSTFFGEQRFHPGSQPDVIPRKLDEEKQKAFIESYDKLLNSLRATKQWCSRTRCIQPMPRGPPAAGAEPREARD